MRALLIFSIIVILVFAFLFGSISNLEWDLMLELRLPRIALAFFVGAGLALAGSVLQALFQNPLCDPYTLGISPGAALGAVIGVSSGWGTSLSGLVICAFLGAMAFSSVLFVLSFWESRNGMFLLLSGVMLGFVGSGCVTLWISQMDPQGVTATMGWLFGDLTRLSIEGVLGMGLVVILLGLMIRQKTFVLDAFLLGEDHARGLGVDVAYERRILLVLCSVLIATCVSAAGMIGFIGLLVPHLARRWKGALHQNHWLELILLGGGALVLSDLISRSLFRPVEVPVGAITALLGAPFFVLILNRNRVMT